MFGNRVTVKKGFSLLAVFPVKVTFVNRMDSAYIGRVTCIGVLVQIGLGTILPAHQIYASLVSVISSSSEIVPRSLD